MKAKIENSVAVVLAASVITSPIIATIYFIEYIFRIL